MKVAVWDTYVTKKDGTIMHFDIIAPQEITSADLIYNYGKQYLKSIGQEAQPLTTKECTFCHVQKAKPEWETTIKKQGYYIYEMENCG